MKIRIASGAILGNASRISLQEVEYELGLLGLVSLVVAPQKSRLRLRVNHDCLDSGGTDIDADDDLAAVVRGGSAHGVRLSVQG
jgi:hypothetical protein